jgi:hypothetical protein
MLRASLQQAGRRLELRSVGNDVESSGDPVADALLTFTDALIGRNAEALAEARSQLRAVAGEGSVAAAAGAAGNFEMMNRILDATGVPVSSSMRQVAASLSR